GKAAVGEFYLFVALVTACQLVTEGGVGTVLTCRLARSSAGAGETLAEAAGLFALLVVGAAALLVGLGGVWAWGADDPALVPRAAAAGVACAAVQVQRFCAAVFRAFEQFGYDALARALQGAALAGLVAGLVGTGCLGAQGAMNLFALSQLLAAAFLLGCLHR